MIWDGSKAFSFAFFNDSRQFVPIPAVINSSRILAKAGNNISASFGQTNLYDADETPAFFIKSNESTYNVGTVMSYKGNGLRFSVGSFSSSYNHAGSGGAVLSSNALKIPFGSLILGGGYFANEEQNFNKTTGGGFIEYSMNRLKLNFQAAQSRYSNSDIIDTSFYIVPEYKLSDNLYLKAKFIRNITQETMQNEMGLAFRPQNNPNNIEFEINTSNQYMQNENINRRIKFSTSFKI